MKTRGWIIVVSCAALLIAGVVFLVRRASAASSKPQFTTAPVDKGKIVAKVTATGTVSALVTVQVGSQVSGRIKALNADFNSQVKKGDLLATIDPELFDAALEQSRANAIAAQGDLTAAKVRAADAERQYNRAKTLFEKSLIAQADLETAQATMEAARAQVSSAEGHVAQNKAQLHQAEVNLTYTKIFSPIDGIVISRSVDVGQTVAASLSAPTLFVLAEDLAKMQVDTSVAEADVGKLHPGMTAYFTVDAYPSDRFSGSVRQIRNAPQTVQNVVTYDAVIDVANPDLKLRPGMTANVTFIYAEKDDAMRVPNAALRFRPSPELFAAMGAANGAGGAPGAGGGWRGGRGGSGAEGQGQNGQKQAQNQGQGQGAAPDRGPETPNKKRVFVLRGEVPQSVPVTTGVTDGSFTEVTAEGLQEGDQVITDMQTDGSKPPAATPGMGPGQMRRVF